MKNKSQSGYPPLKFPKSPAIDYSVEVLSNLVSFPTIHPKTDAHVACVEYLSRELESMGFQVRVFEAHNDENQVNNAGPVLLAVLQGNFDKGPHIHFNGHYDVVPAGTGWNYPPFQLTRNGKDLIGRGTADMKGGIAVVLGALHAYLEQKKIINGMLSLSIVPDEERGGKLGSRIVVEMLQKPPDIVFIPEPSMPFLYSGHRGVLQWMMKVMGVAAHASVPQKGVNSLLQGLKLIENLLGAHNDYMNRYYDINDPEKPTLMVGGIAYTGKAINVVPDQFNFSVDRRIAVNETITGVNEWYSNWLNRISKEFNVSAEIVNQVEPAVTSLQHPLVIKSLDAIKQTLGSPPEVKHLMGFSDMWYFTKKFAIPGLIFGPGREGQAHVANEKLDVPDLEIVLQCYVTILSSFFDDLTTN